MKPLVAKPVDVAWFKRQVAEVQRAIDDSTDTRGALGVILQGVYTRWALDMADGKLGIVEIRKDVRDGNRLADAAE